MTEKTVNYTPEMTAEMVKAYKAETSQEGRLAVVEAMAEKFGKSVRSVVAKLSREGVYVAKQYQTKNGSKPVRKEQLVEDIADVFNISMDKVEGLEKAPKRALEAILNAVS